LKSLVIVVSLSFVLFVGLYKVLTDQT